jgi:hypothetical protein
MDVDVGDMGEISSSCVTAGRRRDAWAVVAEGGVLCGYLPSWINSVEGFAGEGRPHCSGAGDSKGWRDCPFWWGDTVRGPVWRT